MLFRRPGFFSSVASMSTAARRTMLAGGVALLTFFVASFSGCNPSIGDSCQVSTNCSSAGDRLCDLAQPGGYCTIFNCQPNSCPDEAACVLFHPNVPGCSYYDTTAPRSSKSFCEKKCSSNSDCRDGYECADPTQHPWDAFVIDSTQGPHICVPVPSVQDDAGSPAQGGDGGADGGGADGGDLAVCLAGSVFDAGEIDGAVPRPDAGSDASVSDAGAKDAGDAGADGGK